MSKCLWVFECLYYLLFFVWVVFVLSVSFVYEFLNGWCYPGKTVLYLTLFVGYVCFGWCIKANKPWITSDIKRNNKNKFKLFSKAKHLGSQTLRKISPMIGQRINDSNETYSKWHGMYMAIIYTQCWIHHYKQKNLLEIRKRTTHWQRWNNTVTKEWNSTPRQCHQSWDFKPAVLLCVHKGGTKHNTTKTLPQ